MDHDEFVREFKLGTTVHFNWQRFDSERWPIEFVPLQLPADLCRCFVPWYPQNQRVRLSEIPSLLSLLPQNIQNGIQGYVTRFKASTVAVRFRAPAYSLPGNEFMIMDGNHRLCALALTTVPFELELCSVKGPLDKTCLLDLERWLPGSGP